MQEERKPSVPHRQGETPDYVAFDPMTGGGPPGIYKAPSAESGGHTFEKRVQIEKSPQDEEHAC